MFLGIPLVAGYLTRRIGERRKGREWYETRFLPRIGPLALYGLLFTIVVLFALQGETILAEPLDVARIAVPLLVYFAVMWSGSFVLGYSLRLGYPRTRHLRLPLPETTSSWRSPCASAHSASHPVKPLRDRSDRSSRCPPSSGWSTSRSGLDSGSSRDKGRARSSTPNGARGLS